jgi:ParB family transcriptional regulator, chromosome partitioning protein
VALIDRDQGQHLSRIFEFYPPGVDGLVLSDQGDVDVRIVDTAASGSTSCTSSPTSVACLCFRRLVISPAWHRSVWTVIHTPLWLPWSSRSCRVPRSSRAPVSLAAVRDVARMVPAVQDPLAYEVPVADIRPSPRNPRRAFDGIDELADSIHAHGLLQPIVVRRFDTGYELVAGHRRLTAIQQLGWIKVPAIVRDEDPDDAYILTLVENLQRENLSAKEEAAALEVLVRERGWSTRQVGQAINRGPMYVSRRLRVFEDQTLAPLVLADQLPVSTAEELLVVADADRRGKLAKHAVAERWERPQIRAAVRDCIAAIQPGRPRLASRIRALTDELEATDPATLNARVRRELARLIRVARLYPC